MLNKLAIIPCRLDSSRLPNKPLKIINGYSLLQHCYFKTCLAVGKKQTYVATCDKEILKHVKSFNGNCIMTSNKHERATTRTFEALIKIEKKFKTKFKNILMVQGDEPTIMSKDLNAFFNNHIKKNMEFLI